MDKKSSIKSIVHEIAFENEREEYLDVEYHVEGYITLNIEHSGKFTIGSLEELTDIYEKIKELITQK